MICKKCGFEVSNGDFCPNCGTKVEETPVVNEPIIVDGEPVGKNPGKVKGIIGMILGIVSVVSLVCCACCCIYPIYGWIAYCAIAFFALGCAIAGLILSSSGLKSSVAAGFTNGMAKVGKILSIISLILAIVLIVAIIVIVILVFVLGIGGGLLATIMESASSASNSVYSDPYYYY